MSEIAFTGLGTFGRGMVRKPSRAGHAVTAWNRAQRPLPAELESIAQADSIADAVHGKRIVFACVAGPNVQRAVFEEGLLERLDPDVPAIDSTMTDPEESPQIALNTA